VASLRASKNVDTLEKTNKVIGLTATPIKNTFFQLIGFAIVGGADVNKFTLHYLISKIFFFFSTPFL
jgi:hypothetical protein